MITQTIKNWLRKLFPWWPWREPTQIEYPPIASSLNMGPAQESPSRSIIDGMTPQTGITSRLSTVENRPERFVQPTRPPSSEGNDLPPPLPALPPKAPEAPIPLNTRETMPSSLPPSPTFQQKLEFLQYLVKRGIVNEGFAEGQLPEQYRKE